MAGKGRQSVRKPATKLPHLRRNAQHRFARRPRHSATARTARNACRKASNVQKIPVRKGLLLTYRMAIYSEAVY